jgi:thiamine biosynthesis protein ThiC
MDRRCSELLAAIGVGMLCCALLIAAVAGPRVQAEQQDVARLTVRLHELDVAKFHVEQRLKDEQLRAKRLEYLLENRDKVSFTEEELSQLTRIAATAKQYKDERVSVSADVRLMAKLVGMYLREDLGK